MNNKLIGISEINIPEVQFSDLWVGCKFKFLKRSRTTLRHGLSNKRVYYLVDAIKTSERTFMNMNEYAKNEYEFMNASEYTPVIVLNKREQIAKKNWVVFCDFINERAYMNTETDDSDLLVWPKDLGDWDSVSPGFTYRVLVPFGNSGLGGGWYFTKKPLWHKVHGWYCDPSGHLITAGITDDAEAIKSWHKQMQKRPKKDIV